MKHAMTKATDISRATKELVWERDGCCILCGNPNAMPNAHFISRAHGGMGVPENVVTLCMACHTAYDQSDQRKALRGAIRAYLRDCYPEWDEETLVYRKYDLA